LHLRAYFVALLPVYLSPGPFFVNHDFQARGTCIQPSQKAHQPGAGVSPLYELTP